MKSEKSFIRAFDDFKKTLNGDAPPEDLSDTLKALWWDGKGNWDKAHYTAQNIQGADGAWIHAYLHRKEGDEGNAAYWYSHAGRPKSTQSINVEWEQIVKAFL